MADLRGQQLKDSYQNLVTDSGSNLSGIQNGNGVDITARIVERGSNSDGEFVRFADGTQIVTAGRINRPLALGSGTFSNPFRTNASGFDFPVPFNSAPDYIATGHTSDASQSTGFNITGSITASGVSGAQIWSSSDSSDLSGFAIAIGTWK